MENLNRTIEKAAMPKLSPVTVNRKFLYSLCAALFLLTCSLTSNAKSFYRSLPGYGYGFYYGAFTGGSGTSFSDAYDLNDNSDVNHYLGFSSPGETDFQNAVCINCSPLSGVKFLKLTVANDGYVTIMGGTASFDSVFELYDSSQNLITSGDDGYGSNSAQPIIQEYLNSDYYYLKVYGKSTPWYGSYSDVNISYYLQ
jgi:hypothetical protein